MTLSIFDVCIALWQSQIVAVVVFICKHILTLFAVKIQDLQMFLARYSDALDKLFDASQAILTSIAQCSIKGKVASATLFELLRRVILN
jgi:hypothetical protein